MNYQERLDEFFNYWETILDESEREMLLELSRKLDNVKTAFENQSEAIKLHVLKVQIYGYESTAIQTIYDIYDILFEWKTRGSVKGYLKDSNKIYNWLDPFKDNSEYELFYRRKKKTLNDQYGEKRPKLEKMDYTKVNEIFKYIAGLIAEGTYYDDDNRYIFYNEVRKILRV